MDGLYCRLRALIRMLLEKVTTVLNQDQALQIIRRSYFRGEFLEFVEARASNSTLVKAYRVNTKGVMR